MITRNFPIEDILTISTGVLLSKDGIGGAQKLTAFLFGDPDGSVYTLTLAQLQPEAARRLIAQHPELPREHHTFGIGPLNWHEYVEQQKARLGDTLPVELGEPLPPSA